MSYLKKIEYEIVPKESFTVIRNCSGCGRKASFKNTKRFRVNANGNKLDVWLIYQCEKCKHTFNLSIYERQRASSLPKGEYECFLNNDELLAEKYGRSFPLFAQNKAEVDTASIDYQFIKISEAIEVNHCVGQTVITIHNPYGLKIRPEKQASEILNVSRNQVKKMIEEEKIRMEYDSLRVILLMCDKEIKKV